jgi:hypothetical protein
VAGRNNRTDACLSTGTTCTSGGVARAANRMANRIAGSSDGVVTVRGRNLASRRSG